MICRLDMLRALWKSLLGAGGNNKVPLVPRRISDRRCGAKNCKHPSESWRNHHCFQYSSLHDRGLIDEAVG